MKDYELDYIVSYLKDKLNYDIIDIVDIGGKIIIGYKFKEIVFEIEIGQQFVVDNDIIQISRRCKREICNKMLYIMHKEEY